MSFKNDSSLYIQEVFLCTCVEGMGLLTNHFDLGVTIKKLNILFFFIRQVLLHRFNTL